MCAMSLFPSLLPPPPPPPPPPPSLPPPPPPPPHPPPHPLSSLSFPSLGMVVVLLFKDLKCVRNARWEVWRFSFALNVRNFVLPLSPYQVYLQHLNERRAQEKEDIHQVLPQVISSVAESSLVPRPLIQCVYRLQYNACDTESDPCWGWFGSGTKTKQKVRSDVVGKEREFNHKSPPSCSPKNIKRTEKQNPTSSLWSGYSSGKSSSTVQHLVCASILFPCLHVLCSSYLFLGASSVQQEQ